MNEYVRAALINQAVARCIASCAGYTAANQQRKAVGNSMAYSEDGFFVAMNGMDLQICQLMSARTMEQLGAVAFSNAPSPTKTQDEIDAATPSGEGGN